MQSKLLSRLFARHSADQVEFDIKEAGPVELDQAVLGDVAGGLGPNGTWAASSQVVAPPGPNGTW